jgi:hypothetical protein
MRRCWRPGAALIPQRCGLCCSAYNDDGLASRTVGATQHEGAHGLLVPGCLPSRGCRACFSVGRGCIHGGRRHSVCQEWIWSTVLSSDKMHAFAAVIIEPNLGGYMHGLLSIPNPKPSSSTWIPDASRSRLHNLVCYIQQVTNHTSGPIPSDRSSDWLAMIRYRRPRFGMLSDTLRTCHFKSIGKNIPPKTVARNDEGRYHSGA